MPSLLSDLRTFLFSQGYNSVFELQYPPTPDEMISLHERENPNAFGVRGINYGIRSAPIQIRVRRKTPDEAEATAQQLFHLLDSGSGEGAIELTPERHITSRPLPPFFLEQDDKGRWVWVLKTTILTCGL